MRRDTVESFFGRLMQYRHALAGTFAGQIRFSVFLARARLQGPSGFGRPRHYLTDMLAVSEQDAEFTVYSPDLSLYGDFNEVYRSHFEGDFPARAFIGSGPLLFGMRFEMQAIAVR